ncbi:TPA: hypothetical protein DIC20_01295 [Candidatus Dependentiae bacterium]|nr:MAG: Mammalian cell entry related domain protein [candidate division TM6 bacterium GW2011_GWF2_36_131]KKQ03566.1 MAG: Mammalian cell entry related domain protein [candidate division TM6 bacterium GW2011_GWE2_36_25]KKQ20158.1 MAG: Mammalian cell entry related domain protein [candidate division TM6 bacterium GW2011_GWA2_36_9]HBR70700.1 hypothetical protein [Candidatus Dependentiae bacterium]HCU00320.1 hypothetical protein [Candidatus Dependentiae bacterium]
MHIKTETKVGIFVLTSLGILAFMFIQLGVFRFNVKRYQPYEVYFEDVSGVTEKSDVKIAGVKVGWIEKITLLKDMQARVQMMVKKRYNLHRDAYALIRQEGLLGSKYLEIMTGNPELAVLPPGSLLPRPGVVPVSMESLLSQFKQITENVRDVTASFSGAFGNTSQQQKLETLVTQLAEASEHINSLAGALSRAVGFNESNINSIVADVKQVASDIKQAVPEIKKSIDFLSERLDKHVLPAFQESIEKIANVFDRDFGSVAKKLEQTATTIEETVKEARSGIGSLKSVSDKVDQGQGLLGKLINDETVYNDIKSVTTSFRQNMKKIDDLHVEVNAHGESMTRATDCYCHHDNKGYLNMRFYMSPSWFYNLQMVTSEKGWPDRWYRNDIYLDKCCNVINPDTIVIDDGNVKVAPNMNSVCVKRNATRFDFQVGKAYESGVALRAGTFENTFGFGVDYKLPINSDVFKWIMSLELYDLYGRNRLVCDRRPHLKWINSLYLFNNFYLTAGMDDFVSRCNKSPFFGGGLCFTDDDLKHVASKIGVFGTH